MDLDEVEVRPFVKRSFTTAPGDALGTTLVDATLVEPNDFWNDSWLLIRNGTYAGHLRKVTGFVSATHTITLDHAVGGQIARGVQYAMLYSASQAGSPVIEEMAPFDALYLPLTEVATLGATTTVDHFPIAGLVWYISKVFITTSANTTAQLSIQCDDDGVLVDVEALIPAGTPVLEIDLKSEYGMPLRCVQLTMVYVNTGLADENQALVIKGVEVLKKWGT